MPESVPDFTEIFDRLIAEECRFVLMGGLAMIAHGWPWNTFDTDISIARDRVNVIRIVKALGPLTPGLVGFSGASVHVGRGGVARNEPRHFDHDGWKLRLTEPEGIDSFGGLFSRAIDGEVMRRKTKIASVEDLFRMKKAAVRVKDLEDLRYLEIIAERKGGFRVDRS